MTELKSYLKAHFNIPEEYMDETMPFFNSTELKKGAYLVKSGQYCKQLSFVHTGFLRMYATVNDKEVTQWIASQGHFITDVQSFSFKQKSKWSIQALTDCQLYTIYKSDYDRLTHYIPNWLTIEKHFTIGCLLQMEARIFSFLSLTAYERYNQLFSQNKALFNKVPLQYIASMLGMSPETLSRIRKEQIS